MNRSPVSHVVDLFSQAAFSFFEVVFMYGVDFSIVEPSFPLKFSLLEVKRQLFLQLKEKFKVKCGRRTYMCVELMLIILVDEDPGTLKDKHLERHTRKNCSDLFLRLTHSKLLGSVGLFEHKTSCELRFRTWTRSNWIHHTGWIAAARLEDVVGDIKTARNFIQRGCKGCPKKEAVWLEVCRLASSRNMKTVLAQGVEAIPNSVKLWLQAADLEGDDSKKSPSAAKSS